MGLVELEGALHSDRQLQLPKLSRAGNPPIFQLLPSLRFTSQWNGGE